MSTTPITPHPKTDMTQVMIDIETLGTHADSVILSIGAVAFSLEGGVSENTFYTTVDLADSLARGRSITADTLKWWLTDGANARGVFRESGVPMAEALQALAAWYPAGAEVWANGPSFDASMLEDSYKSVGQQPPWRFWATRCVRTYRALPGAQNVPKPPMTGIAHNALSDAVNQAQHVVAIHQTLFQKKEPLQ